MYIIESKRTGRESLLCETTSTPSKPKLFEVCGGVEGRAPATSPTGFKRTPNDALMAVAGSWMSGGDSRFRDPSFGLSQWGTLTQKKPPSALAWPGYDCVNGGALNDAGEELTFGGRAPFEPRGQVPEGCMTFRVR